MINQLQRMIGLHRNYFYIVMHDGTGLTINLRDRLSLYNIEEQNYHHGRYSQKNATYTGVVNITLPVGHEAYP
jgi:hypothetical protein